MGAVDSLAARCLDLEPARGSSARRRGSRSPKYGEQNGPGPLDPLGQCMQSAQNAALMLLYGTESQEAPRIFNHPVSERLKLTEFGQENMEDEERKTLESFFHALRTADFRKVVDSLEEGTGALTQRTLRGQDVVMLASASQSPQAVVCLQFLVDAKMGIENKDMLGWTPLAHACRNDALEASKFLLDKRAFVNSQDVMGRTPLMLSCMEGSEMIPALLIEAEAQIPLKDTRGWTALFYASERGKQDLVKFLLRKYASPQAFTPEGVSALMVACVRGNTMAAKQLIRRRGDANQVEKSGNSALMLALAAAQQDLVAWLLQEDVDVDLSNELGETAYDIAARQGFNSLKSTILMISRKREEARRKESLEAAAREAMLGQED